MSPDDDLVSFATVASEEAEQSVAHEAEATAALAPDVDLDAVEADEPLEDNTAPEDPTITSVTGFGPVGDSDDLRL